MSLQIDWNDVLEVGQGGPGCGLLHINGRQPKGGYRYLPPALEHEGKVYASSFVPGGFIVCEIDCTTMVRREISPRLPYARLERIEDGGIVYVDRYDGDSTSRLEIAPPTSLLARLKGRFVRS